MGQSNQAKSYETREAILDAVGRLLLTTDYDRITVKEVIAEANVSRSTFYRYFFSVDQALDELEDIYIDAILDINRLALTSKLSEGSVQPSPTLVMRLEFLQRKRETTLALGSPHASPRFVAKETEVMRSYFSEKARGSALSQPEMDLYISYCITGHNELICTWLTTYPELPATTVAGLLNRLFYAPLLS